MGGNSAAVGAWPPSPWHRERMLRWNDFAGIPRAKGLLGVPLLLPLRLDQVKRILSATRHRSGSMAQSQRQEQARGKATGVIGSGGQTGRWKLLALRAVAPRRAARGGGGGGGRRAARSARACFVAARQNPPPGARHFQSHPKATRGAQRDGQDQNPGQPSHKRPTR